MALGDAIAKRELDKLRRLRQLKRAYDLIRTGKEVILIEAVVRALEEIPNVADEA